MYRFKGTIKKIWKFFAWKDGEPSKTSFFMSLATFVAITQWFMQGLFKGANIYGFVVPEFDFAGATAMLTTISTLYIVNHKIKAKISKGKMELNSGEGENG